MSIKEKLRSFFERKGIYVYRIGQEGFFTYWSRPKKAENIICTSSSVEDVAIVIQGPIKYEDDFTLETVKLYKKMFPKCEIIVSTWSNEKKEVLDKIEEAGAKVVLSEPFLERKGLDYSINFQRKNTGKGIHEALENHFTFCAKTRSDQRIYNSNSLEYCKKLVESIDIEPGTTAKGRIISTSIGTFKNRYYNISDLFLFGYTEDLLKYYSCPEDTREHNLDFKPKDLLEYSKLRTGEIWFSTHYLESIGYTLKWTKEDNDRVMADYFIIIDGEDIDLFWPKYTNEEYRWRRYDHNQELEQVTFADWYVLYKSNRY